MSWEINFSDDFSEYIEKANLCKKDFIKINESLKHISQSPLRLSRQIQGVPYSNLRRIKYRNYRIFILLELNLECIYCLGLYHRSVCYNKRELNNILSQAKKIYNTLSK